MSATAIAMWCIHCGALPEVTLSVERNSVLAHYGACMAHVHQVADRMLADLGMRTTLGPIWTASSAPAPGPEPKRTAAIDATSD